MTRSEHQVPSRPTETVFSKSINTVWDMKLARGHRLERVSRGAITTLAVSVALSACAPAITARDLEPTLSLSNRGELAWTVNGDGFVALPPSYTVQKLTSPGIVSSVAWHDGTPWMALPGAGSVVRGLGVPESVSVAGRPVRLSSRFIFTNANTVYSYAGVRVAQLPGAVRDVLETPNQTLVLVDAAETGLIFELTDKGSTAIARTSNETNLKLLPTDTGFEVVRGPVARANGVTYRLQDNRLESVRVGGSIGGSATLEATPTVIVANTETVATLSSTSVTVFRAVTLEPLTRIRLEVSP
jgi:hypothetical protein